MMEKKPKMIEYTVKKNEDGLRIDNLVRKIFGFNYSQIQKIFRKQLVKCNEKKATTSLKVVCGDKINVYVNECLVENNFIFTSPAENAMDQGADVSMFIENEKSTINADSAHLECAQNFATFYNTENSKEQQKYINALKNMIIFESCDVLVLNKQSGLSVQLGSKLTFSLETLLKAYFGQEKYYLLHRLDKDTSGVLLIGKNIQTARSISHAFKEKLVKKTYISILERFEKSRFNIKPHGVISNYLMKVRRGGEEKVCVIDEKKITNLNEESEEISENLLQKFTNTPKNNLKSNAKNNFNNDSKNDFNNDLKNNHKNSLKNSYKTTSKHNLENKSTDERKPLLAITNYKVLQKFSENEYLVEFMPLTGRTHQLRVHASENLKSPIVGDFKYGYIGDCKRLLLHACKISIDSLGLEFCAPIPDYIANYLKAE